MSTTDWFLLIGCLMLARGLAATTISRLPVTSAIVYLVVGVVLGPMVLNLFRFDPIHHSRVMETLTEIAVLISLFSAGVKMPVPIILKRWSPSIRLAWLSMSITVALVAVFSYYVLGLPLGAGVLLGAILAPTDPVLATDVQVRHAGDHDTLRFTLTSEAGMNDGSGFPYVMLGLALLGVGDVDLAPTAGNGRCAICCGPPARRLPSAPRPAWRWDGWAGCCAIRSPSMRCWTIWWDWA